LATPLFIFAGDLHLSHFIWSNARQVVGDSQFGFSQVVDKAISYGVPLILTGDVFDSVKPDSQLVEFFRSEMERLRRANIVCYAIQGNHDRQVMPWYCAASDWPIHVGDARPFEIGGFVIQGLDYAVRDVIEEQMAKLAVQARLPDILLLHQACRQFIRFNGAWNFDTDWIPAGVRLACVGDLHAFLQGTALHGCQVWYSGATHAREWPQTGPKACCLVDTELGVTRVPIVARDFTKMTLEAGTTDQEVQNALQGLQDRLGSTIDSDLGLPPVLKLCWSHESLAALEAARRWLGVHDRQADLKGLIVLEDQFQNSQALVEAPTESADDVSLPSPSQLMSQIIDPQAQPVAYSLALNLVGNQADAIQVVTDARTRFLAARRPQAASCSN
jgi:DNA repair exonuclease SbcCD nuclease subunit